MSRTVEGRRPVAATPPQGRRPRDLVLPCCALLVAAQLIFRAWALYGSWFYTDDYRLLLDARSQGLSWGSLTTPFDSQFMPFGRFVVWLVSERDGLDWGAAATLTLVLQTAAGAACVWMLLTCFGRRWAVLAPLSLYLSTAVTMPALMWWAAAVNQLPLQAVLFTAVAAWVRHLRSGSRTWAWATLAVLAAGLLCYVKVLLVVPVLAYLTVAYFSQGSLRHRVGDVWRRHRGTALAAGLLAGGFVLFYATSVPQPFESGRDGHGADVAGAMLGTALPVGLLGGPWRWLDTSPPIVLAGPPATAVHLSWVVLALLVALSLLRRRHAGRGWLLLAGYAAALFLLLVTSRGQLYGSFAGLEYRYLTDLAGVAALVAGLVFLELPGAVEGSRPRARPLLLLAPGRWLVTGGVVVAVAGGLASSVGYVDFWHHHNAGKPYVAELRRSLAEAGATPQLAGDQLLPADVMPAYTAPENTVRRFLPLLGEPVSFPTTSSRLQVVDPSGRVVPALVRPEVASRPGPVDGCGYKIRATGADVPLQHGTVALAWWTRIGYLASSDSAVTISAGDGEVTRARVERGLHSLFVRLPGAYDSVRVDGLDDGATLCVDRIDVGFPVPAPQEAP